MPADNRETREEWQHTSDWGSKDQGMENLTPAGGRIRETEKTRVCTCPGHGKRNARVWPLASYATSGRQATSPL